MVVIASEIAFVRGYTQVVSSLDSRGFLAAREVYLEEAEGLSDKFFLYSTHITLLGIALTFQAARYYARAREAGLRPTRMSVNMVALITLFAALLTTGRTAPLLAILSYSLYCLRFHVYSRLSVLTGFGVAAALMFIAVAFAMGKEGLGDDFQISTSDALMNMGRVYLFAGPAAAQEVIMHKQVVSNACSNLALYPIELMQKFGLFSGCPALKLDFVFVPVATNTYTILRAYWEDFGFAFPLALFVTGYIIDLIYRSAIESDGFGAFIYPFFLNAVLLQTFEEQIFVNGSVFFYLSLAYVVTQRILSPRRGLTPRLGGAGARV